MEIKVIAVEIPCAECMAVVSNKVKEEKEREATEKYNAWRAQIDRDTEESIPKLISYLSNLIVEKSTRGGRCLDINLVDSFMEYCKNDPRNSFFFKGEFSWGVAKKIKEIFEKCGYYALVNTYQNMNGMCYRSGSVYISW